MPHYGACGLQTSGATASSSNFIVYRLDGPGAVQGFSLFETYGDNRNDSARTLRQLKGLRVRIALTGQWRVSAADQILNTLGILLWFSTMAPMFVEFVMARAPADPLRTPCGPPAPRGPHPGETAARKRVSLRLPPSAAGTRAAVHALPRREGP